MREDSSPICSLGGGGDTSTFWDEVGELLPQAQKFILAGKTVFLLVLTALVCAAVFTALLLRRPKSALSRLALAMVLGGAVGNALDRLADGFVTDMIELLFMDFPIFNVADCFITVGGILFCLSIFLEERQSRRKPTAVGKEAGDEAGTDRGA